MSHNHDTQDILVFDRALRAHPLEIAASPMLGLIELRALGETGLPETRFLDLAEAGKLSSRVAAEAAALCLELGCERGRAVAPGERFEVVRRFGAEDERGWVIFDHVRWGILSASFPDGRDAEAKRWAQQLNESDRLVER